MQKRRRKAGVLFLAWRYYFTTAIFSFLPPLKVNRVSVPSLMSPLSSKVIGPVTPS